jgi:hypothetical protein
MVQGVDPPFKKSDPGSQSTAPSPKVGVQDSVINCSGNLPAVTSVFALDDKVYGPDDSSLREDKNGGEDQVLELGNGLIRHPLFDGTAKPVSRVC